MKPTALALCPFAGAVLYTPVGHAGASAYIAIMALFGVPPLVMRPTARALNVLVPGLISVRYLRAGLFCLPTLWPFVVSAIPMAWLGGRSSCRVPIADLLSVSFVGSCVQVVVEQRTTGGIGVERSTASRLNSSVSLIISSVS